MEPNADSTTNKEKEYADSLFPPVNKNIDKYDDLKREMFNFKDSFYLLKVPSPNMNNKSKEQINKSKLSGKNITHFLDYKMNINKKQLNYPYRKNLGFPSIKNYRTIDNEISPINFRKSPNTNTNSIYLYGFKNPKNIKNTPFQSLPNIITSKKKFIPNETFKTINNSKSTSQNIMFTVENMMPNAKKTISHKNSNKSTCLNDSSNNKINISYSNDSSHCRKKSEFFEEIRNIPKILNNKVKEINMDQGKCVKMLKKVEKRSNKMNLKISSKLKYAKWKYQISDYKKYFIDVESFGEKERQEIEKRKTFYDILEDMVDMVIENKMRKKYMETKIDSVNEQYEQDKDKRKNMFKGNLVLMKEKFLQKCLKKVDKRKLIEKQKRNQIKKILSDSEFNKREALKIKTKK